MKLFFYCKRQLQMDMTYTWSQITITFWLFLKCVLCVLHACYTLFLTFEIVRFISSGAFWNNCWKFCKNKHLLWNFLRATIMASFSDFVSSWRHWFKGRYSPCVAKTISLTVVPLSPSSPKRSVPNGKHNKFLKINKVFRLLILPHYTKMLRNPNGHYLSFVKAESMQLLFWGSV